MEKMVVAAEMIFFVIRGFAWCSLIEEKGGCSYRLGVLENS